MITQCQVSVSDSKCDKHQLDEAIRKLLACYGKTAGSYADAFGTS